MKLKNVQILLHQLNFIVSHIINVMSANFNSVLNAKKKAILAHVKNMNNSKF